MRYVIGWLCDPPTTDQRSEAPRRQSTPGKESSMRSHRASALAFASAIPLAMGLAAPGVAAADDFPTTFTAADNGDCTATFTIENKVNIGGDWAKINYWVGVNAPERAPEFGDNRGSDGSVKADPASINTNGDTVEPYRAGGYHNDLDQVDTVETVDFSEYAELPQNARAGEGEVNISYRFTGVDTKDYDNGLKKLIITGCDDDDALGSIGSIDVFGSLSAPLGSISNVFGS